MTESAWNHLPDEDLAWISVALLEASKLQARPYRELSGLLLHHLAAKRGPDVFTFIKETTGSSPEGIVREYLDEERGKK